MKKFLFFLLFSMHFTTELTAQSGFSSVTRLSPVPITYSTKEKPQAKVWTHAGKWWCVLATSSGTKIFRLDGTSWTPTLTLNTTSSSRPDCRVDGDLVHVLLYRGASSNSYIYSVQYDAVNQTYKFWSQRPTGVALNFPGSTTATLAVDGTGRMWVTSDAASAIQVRWSDAPYTTWSTSISLATGIDDDDICAIAALPGKIGVFWSNQVTQRFGFRTHTDGSDPTAWSADEVPASQSALQQGTGMADDHLNVIVASDGTLYAAVKSGYKTTGFPRIMLLVRRPNGTWDNAYSATTHPEGEKPIVILNEALGKVKLVFTSADGGGDILYRESPTSNISFGPAQMLMNANGQLYDYTTSTHQSYTSEIVMLATNTSTSPLQAEGVLATDVIDNTAPIVQSINRQSPTTETTNAGSVTFQVTFSETVTGVDIGDFSLGKTGATDGAIASINGSGAIYDVTVNNITGDGTLKLDLKGSGTGIQDAAGNAVDGGFTAGQSYTINQNLPTLTSVSIASNNANSALAKAGDVITLSFTASEPINTPVVTIATHSVTAVAGASNSYTATYTLTASDAAGAVPFTIDFSNTLGTAGVQVSATTNSSSVSFDNAAPTVVSINRQSPTTELTNATEVTFRAIFSEAVSGVDEADFHFGGTVTGTLAVTPVGSDGTTYDVTVSAISGTGILKLDLNTSVMDAAGNNMSGGFTGGQSYTIDLVAPAVVSINRQSPANETTSDNSLIFRVTFSEKVKGVEIGDFSLTTGPEAYGGISAVNAVGAEGTTYDITVSSISGSGSLGLQLNSTGTGITDEAGNAINGGFTTGESYTIDQSAPEVVSINRQSPTDESISATTVTFRVIFSEVVTGVDETDFTLTKTGTADGAIASIISNGDTYDVTVNNISGSGTLRLDLNSSGTGITDASGTTCSGFTTGQSYTIDLSVPAVVSINRQSPTTETTNASSVTFRVTFSEEVIGVDASDFSFGATVTGSLAVAAVDGATYDVTVSSITGNGTLRLDLNSTGTGITDVSNNEVSGGFTTGQSYTIDQSAPIVQSINRQSPASETTAATEVTFRAIFSEGVTGVDIGDFALTKGPEVNGMLSGVSAVGTDGTTYDVTVNSISGSGTLRLDLNNTGTGITDAASNAITSGFTSGQSYTINQSVPTLTSVGIASNNANTSLARAGDVVTLSFTASEPINTPTVTIATHSVPAVAGSGNSYTASYTMTAADAAGAISFTIDFISAAGAAGEQVTSTTNGSSVTFDQTTPAVVSINRQSPASETTNATSVTLRTTFSEAVIGVDASDFAFGGTLTGTLSVAAVGTNNITYDVTIGSINGSGSLRLDLKTSGTGITDAAGNAISGGFTTGQSYIIDQVAPAVVSINRQSPTTETTNATSVTFRAIFSEAVTGVDEADFDFGGTVTGSLAVANVGNDGTTYDVTVNSISGSGTLRLDLNNTGTGITDAASNAITSGFTSGQSYTISVINPPPAEPGFVTVTPNAPLGIGGGDTQHKPQAKVWNYDGKWWCAISTGGTYIYRLDGTTWTQTLKISGSNGRTDCWVVGDLVHILIHRGTSTSYTATAQYDPATGAYKAWSRKPSPSSITFPSGTQTATLTVDGTGRMWIASDATSDIRVWYSDAPYTSWSAPITVATGMKDDDMCAITKLPGKIGVFWSNQNTGLFGFKTHMDSDAPATWSADEVPASQSAIPNLPRMADNHMNLLPASDGTLYCAAKTSYNNTNYPQLVFLVRRPSGTWDNLYTVTTDEGTQPILVLNEAMGKIKVVYTTLTNGGIIAYKESSLSNISFGSRRDLITAGGNIYNFASSTHQTYNPEVVIIATDISSSSRKMVSVRASDASSGSSIASSDRINVATAPVEQVYQSSKAASLQLYPNPFSNSATVSFTLSEAGKYTLTLIDSRGMKLNVLKQGWAEAGALNTVSVNASALAGGMYLISLQTEKGTQVLKVLKK